MGITTSQELTCIKLEADQDDDLARLCANQFAPYLPENRDELVALSERLNRSLPDLFSSLVSHPDVVQSDTWHMRQQFAAAFVARLRLLIDHPSRSNFPVILETLRKLNELFPPTAQDPANEDRNGFRGRLSDIKEMFDPNEGKGQSDITGVRLIDGRCVPFYKGRLVDRVDDKLVVFAETMPEERDGGSFRLTLEGGRVIPLIKGVVMSRYRGAAINNCSKMTNYGKTMSTVISVEGLNDSVLIGQKVIEDLDPNFAPSCLVSPYRDYMSMGFARLRNGKPVLLLDGIMIQKIEGNPFELTQQPEFEWGGVKCRGNLGNRPSQTIELLVAHGAFIVAGLQQPLYGNAMNLRGENLEN